MRDLGQLEHLAGGGGLAVRRRAPRAPLRLEQAAATAGRGARTGHIRSLWAWYAWYIMGSDAVMVVHSERATCAPARDDALRSWHSDCVTSVARVTPQRRAGPKSHASRRPPGRRQGGRRPSAPAARQKARRGRRRADAQQQELLVLVAARLAAGALRRADVRRGDGLARRRRRPQGAAAARAVDPRALPDARRARRSGTRWRSPSTSTRSGPRPGCCPTTASPGRTAARSAAR